MRYLFVASLLASFLTGPAWAVTPKAPKGPTVKKKVKKKGKPYSLGYGLSFGFRPNYYAPENAEVSPYVSGSLRLSGGYVVGKHIGGYWKDLRVGASWGLSKALTDNIGMSQVARQIYVGNIGISIGKGIYREKYTGIALSGSLSFSIPTSLSARQRTLITSIGPGLSISRRFFKRLSLSYAIGFNFNIYEQDSGLYHPELAGTPGLNKRWGMSHSFGLGVSIIKGLSVKAGMSIGVGYSFADSYYSPDGPQVYGSDLTAEDRASYPINESNSYAISLGISYKIHKRVGVSFGYSNGGRQFEYQYDDQGNVKYVLRNPFKLQNGSFRFGISGSIL